MIGSARKREALRCQELWAGVGAGTLADPLREQLRVEVARLTSQRQHYLVAIAVANESHQLRRYLRTVQRLDDEIAARKEVLDGLPAESVQMVLGDSQVVLLEDHSGKTTLWQHAI